jgi:hypothetical protein
MLCERLIRGHPACINILDLAYTGEVCLILQDDEETVTIETAMAGREVKENDNHPCHDCAQATEDLSPPGSLVCLRHILNEQCDNSHRQPQSNSKETAFSASGNRSPEQSRVQ